MDDYQVILYIIFGIIYFIFNILKKRKPVTHEDEYPEQEEDTQEQPSSPRTRRREQVSDPFDERVGRPQKPSSFEELLEEFEGASRDAGRRAEEKVRKVQEVDEEFEPQYGTPDTSFTEREAEKRIRETESRKALQEKTSAVQRAAVVDKEVNRKLEETYLESGEERPRSRTTGSSENRRRQQLLEMLNSPEGLKNTVIATEILKRKYF